MIEVEKKFQPTEEQLESMIKDSQFVSDKILKDFYYDYPDYRLFKNKTYFRNRNGNFELKIGDDEVEGVCEEIENEEDIKKYFKTDKPLPEFIDENLFEIIKWECHRIKYKQGDFSIDIDDLNFGFKCVEIEKMVEGPEEVAKAHADIINFTKKYDFEVKDISPKRKAYFKALKPEVYKQLYI
jgi:adenylate cyclase class IV